MIRLSYDETFDPPAPVVPVRLRLPDSQGWLQLVGLVDTGADITVIPAEVAARYLPVAGTLGVRGATGHVEEAIVYRVEMECAGVRRASIVAGLGSEAIVGRDVLNRVVLGLDGPARQLTVAS